MSIRAGKRQTYGLATVLCHQLVRFEQICLDDNRLVNVALLNDLFWGAYDLENNKIKVHGVFKLIL